MQEKLYEKPEVVEYDSLKEITAGKSSNMSG